MIFLADDHAHARLLAERLADIDGLRVHDAGVRTNIVHFELEEGSPLSAEEVCKRLACDHGIALGTYPDDLLRAVTHYWIGEKEVDAIVRGLTAIRQPA